MATKPQTCAIGILTNPPYRRRAVLNFGHFDFEIISDLGIRISDSSLPDLLSSPAYQRIMTLFMQNKPNLLDAQMNVSSILTKYYENLPLRRRGENKPNQTQPVVSLSNLFQRQKNDRNHPKLSAKIPNFLKIRIIAVLNFADLHKILSANVEHLPQAGLNTNDQ